MNLKSKLFGTLAAATVALSMTTGVMAAELDKADAYVTVNKGECSASITEGSVNFGTWYWNGNEYVRESGNNVQTLNGTVINDAPGGTCDFVVAFSGIGSIPMNSFHASAFGLQGNLGSWANTGVPVTLNGGSHSGTLTLQNIPSTVTPTGEMSGVITVSTVGGAS